MHLSDSTILEIEGRHAFAPAAPLPVRNARVKHWPKWVAICTFAGAGVLVTAALGIGRYAWYDVSLMALSDPESSHVLLVPLVFVWLGWHRRYRLRSFDRGGRWLGTSILALGWLLWSTGQRYHVQIFWHGGAVAMAVGALLTITGSGIFWSFLPSFGSLVFLVPVPGTGRLLIAAPLQRLTAYATQTTAELVGLNIQRTGSLLRMNGVDVAIAEACNGMRLVFTLFLACYLFAFATPLRWQVRLLIVAMSPIVAVLSNVTRLVPTVWMYGNASTEAAEKFHDATGWVMLVLAFVGLMGLVRLLQWVGVPVMLPQKVSK